MAQEIRVGDQTHTVEDRPLNLVVPSADMAMGPQIVFPECVSLSPEVTVFHAQKVKVLDPDFWVVWQLFMDNTSPPTKSEAKTPDDIRQGGTGALHVMGLIDLTLKLTRYNKSVVWKYPESYLHPGWAVALADVAIWFSKWK